ncbi:hypothetical protein NRK68_03065 [Streptomyces yangpuensis]|uniref:Uncharacterized protein n=1 Tax=Streptomyces yangpuensis TaxID=1648182 RepID=A0ABY5PQ71_9ACTN|nr:MULTISPECIES: hypothetical protein [Streptomyces]MBZ9594180.1 hypothetical protein [Streptomyces erythrochromogenes]UUY46289.1 hypothetical protein NRK68_03065 [Streptomyces yangpuensis]
MSPEGPDPARAHPPERRRFDAVHLWITTGASLIALAVSLYNLVVLHRQPDVDVALPHVVRLEPRGPEGNVHLFLQPTISSRVRAEDVEIITDAELRLLPGDPKLARPAFYWDESGTYSYDHASNRLSYQRTADPTPLVVAQDSPQQPTLLFNAHAWTVGPGRYEGMLVLHRASTGSPIEKPFCLTVSAAAVRAFTAAPERTFFELRDDVPGTPGACYAF